VPDEEQPAPVTVHLREEALPVRGQVSAQARRVARRIYPWRDNVEVAGAAQCQGLLDEGAVLARDEDYVPGQTQAALLQGRQRP